MTEGAWSALCRIHASMDRQEWSASTLDEIADVLRKSGFVVRPPSDSDEEDGTCVAAVRFGYEMARRGQKWEPADLLDEDYVVERWKANTGR